MVSRSKTIQLESIVLPLQVLQGLEIPFLPRIVRKAAGHFGVSRKPDYQAACWIREILERRQAARPQEQLRRENVRLRIQNQVPFLMDPPSRPRIPGSWGQLGRIEARG